MFKIGDRVRSALSGRRGTVEGYSGTYVVLKMDDRTTTSLWSESSLRLVKEEKLFCECDKCRGK